MISQDDAQRAADWLHKLCVEIDSRRVGGVGNRTATTLVAETMSAYGFATETPPFDCIDWREEGVTLAVGDAEFEAMPSPYSLGGQVTAPLVVAQTAEELAPADAGGKVLLLRGEIAKEQLMPKNFVFYNPDEHKRIVQFLEDKQPSAIAAATIMDPGLAGAVSPFPLIEDGDFDIPSVYMTAEEGRRLAALAGEDVQLDIRATRTPSTGCNVYARKGDPRRRIVLFAHVDAKIGTPGAIDNATGVVTLLLLAELLADYGGEMGIEIVVLNGEDYYAASGEMQYLALNEGRFGEIALGINLDGVGFHEGRTAYSLYGCPEELAGTIHEEFASYPDLFEGDPWYQSDHGLFLMNDRPAVAFTSEQFTKLWMEIAHTPGDVPEIVDTRKLVAVADALHVLLLRLSGELGGT